MIDKLEKSYKKTQRENATKPEPKPTGKGQKVWEEVIKDMQARDDFGKSKYNTRLKTHNGRDALVDAYQEALDLCVYLKQVIMEREKNE